MDQIKTLVDTFVNGLTALIESEARAKVQRVLDALSPDAPALEFQRQAREALDAQDFDAYARLRRKATQAFSERELQALDWSGVTKRVYDAVTRVTPARREAQVLQGRYLGALRPLKGRARAQVKAMRAKRGHEAAIRLARRLGK